MESIGKMLVVFGFIVHIGFFIGWATQGQEEFDVWISSRLLDLWRRYVRGDDG